MKPLIAFVIAMTLGLSAAHAVGVVFSENFEDGVGFWSASNGAWEVGTPTAPSGLVCHGGKKCAATVLSGNYPATNSRLVSEPIQLEKPAANSSLRLRFWHWFSFVHPNHSAQVQVSAFDAARNSWSDWVTVGDTFTGASAAWTSNTIDLTAHAGKQIRLGLLLSAAACCVTSWGWYVDDIEILSTIEPSCDIQLSKAGYAAGETVTAQVARLTNPGPGPVAVEVKTWFVSNTGATTSSVNAGWDGTFVLPPGFDHDYGPLPLGTIAAGTAPGTYEYNCRLSDPVTGRPITLDRNTYTVP